MREIKFRAWREDLKKMSSPFALFDNDENYLLNGDNMDVTDAPIMQYTGLKDKNGKEIYEGDIVEQLDLRRFGELGDKARRTVEVKFQPTSGYDIWPADCEVIGNIYENKDLI